MNNSPSSLSTSTFWRAFEKESFEKAQEAQKAILLILSKPNQALYRSFETHILNEPSTLHWIEQHFIGIQVDIDLRPDVYALYNYICLSLNDGELLWPLFLFLDAKGRAYSAGSWDVEKEKKTPGGFFKQLVDNYQLWREENSRCLMLCEQSEKKLQEYRLSTSPKNAEKKDLKTLTDLLVQTADPLSGGWDNGRGKFLPWNQLNYLFSYHARYPQNTVERLLKRSLLSMLQGGIYDLVEGNFFHCCKQQSWDEPVFEKRCLDNSLAIGLWTQAARTFQEAFFIHIAKRLGESLIKSFVHTIQGGFFTQLETLDPLNEGGYYFVDSSSTPIDSCTFKAQGDEGKMLCLSLKENKSLLGEKEWEALEESLIVLQDQRRGKKGLFKDSSLFLKDNAAALTALLQLYKLLGEAKYLALAEKQKCWIEKHFLYKKPYPRLIRHKKSCGQACLEDLAYLLEAYLTFYCQTRHEEYMEKAIEIQRLVWQEYFFDGEFHTLPASNYLPLSFKEGEDPLYPSAVIKIIKGFYQLSQWGKIPFSPLLMQQLSEVGQGACFQPLLYPGYHQLMLDLCQSSDSKWSIAHLLQQAPISKQKNSLQLPFLVPCVSKADKSLFQEPLIIANDQEKKVNEWRVFQWGKAEQKSRIWSGYESQNSSEFPDLSSDEWQEEVETSLWRLGQTSLEGYLLPVNASSLQQENLLQAFKAMEGLVQQGRLQCYGLKIENPTAKEAKRLYELALKAGEQKSSLKVVQLAFNPFETEEQYLLLDAFLDFCKSRRWHVLVTNSFQGGGYCFLPTPVLKAKKTTEELMEQLNKLEEIWEKYSKRKLISTQHPFLKEWLCKLFQVQKTLETERKKSRNEKDWQDFESLFTHQFLDHFAFFEKHLKLVDAQFLLDFKADFLRLIQEICYEERRLIREKNTLMQRQVERLINPHLKEEEKNAPFLAKWLTLCRQRFSRGSLCLEGSVYLKVKDLKNLQSILPVREILQQLRR